MKDLKFRAWDKENERMYIPNQICKAYGRDDIWIADYIEIGNHDKNVIRNATGEEATAILMQFTGIEDCNHKDIYEGDIVRFRKDGCTAEQGCGDICIGKVSFSYGNFSIDGWNWFETKWFEIVGNIYENPEMLSSNVQEASK